MSSELRLDPERLRAHAVVAAQLSEELLSLGAPPVADPEAARLHAAVHNAVRELTEVGAVLAHAAASAQRADSEVTRSLTGLWECG